MDDSNEDRFKALYTGLVQARATERREAAILTEKSAALKAQEVVWKDANAGLNAAQKALDDYILDHSTADAKAFNDEWARD